MVPGPICHYAAVSLVSRSGHYNLAHDASTKGKLAHIYQYAVTCVLKGSDRNEEVVTAPLKFEVCPSGTAVAEAQLTKGALHCDVAPQCEVCMPGSRSVRDDGHDRGAEERGGGEGGGDGRGRRGTSCWLLMGSSMGLGCTCRGEAGAGRWGRGASGRGGHGTSCLHRII